MTITGKSKTFDDTSLKLNKSLSRPQLNDDGGIRHFLSVEGLSKMQLQGDRLRYYHGATYSK